MGVVMKINLNLFFIFTVLFTSCTNNLADVVLRTYSDPFDETPSVDSFSELNQIKISWNKDLGADDYRLMRACDTNNLTDESFSEIYFGKDLFYVDKDIEQCKKYIYRLDKKRGNKIFYGKKKFYSHGYGCELIKDKLEFNDNIDNAVLLENEFLDLNVLYGKFFDGYEIIDEDWFCVDLPPRRCCEIVLDIKGFERGNSFLYQELNGEAKMYSNEANASIVLNNENMYPVRKYFKIFLSENNQDNTNKILHIPYSIQLVNISHYNPGSN